MSFTVFRSTDIGAPVLNGTTGSLITVLDACLTTGFGLATTGLGWSKAYTSGALHAAYKMKSGVGFYLRVNDAAPVTAKEARAWGYESMTDINTGSGSFPTGIPYLAVRKSSTADSVARPWILAGDNVTFYFFSNAGDGNVQQAENLPIYWGLGFGAIYSLMPGDNYNCVIMARNGDNLATNNIEGLSYLTQDFSTVCQGNYIARGYTGLGGPVNFVKFGDSAKGYTASFDTNALMGLSGQVPLPNPEDGGFMLSQVWVGDQITAPTKNLRGRLRGFWHWLHDYTTVADGDILVGSGDLAGRTFFVIKCAGQVRNDGIALGRAVYIIEISNTLETNYV